MMFLLELNGAKFNSILVRLASNATSDNPGRAVVGDGGMEVVTTKRIFKGEEIVRIPAHCVMTKKLVLHSSKTIAELETLVQWPQTLDQ